MMTSLGLIVLAAFIAYSIFSKALNKTFLTLPILFMLVGYFISEPLLQTFTVEQMHEGKYLLAELTLVLVLFSDASHVRFKQLFKDWSLPFRMLVIGMPLTIGLGMLVAYAFNPGAGLAMALLVAALLTPTDAAVGQAVVSSEQVPYRLRQTINLESGLNDGLALPFVLMGAVFSSVVMIADDETARLLEEALTEVVLAPMTGMLVGWILALMMNKAQTKDWMNEYAGGVCFVCAAFMAYLLAQWIGANGFIAAFVGGMMFGNVYRHDIHFISEFMEGAGQLLTMSAFLMFGAFLLPDGLAHISGKAIILALLFLTVIRMLPIYISLIGTGLTLKEKLFLGWFGPRGIASILFTLLMIDAYDLPLENELQACVSLTVALSIILHGISATPLAKIMGRNGADN